MTFLASLFILGFMLSPFGERFYINSADYADILTLPMVSEEEALLIYLEKERKPFKSFEDFKKRVPLESYTYEVLRERLIFKKHKGRYRFSFSSDWEGSGYIVYKEAGFSFKYKERKVLYSLSLRNKFFDLLRLGYMICPFKGGAGNERFGIYTKKRGIALFYAGEAWGLHITHGFFQIFVEKGKRDGSRGFVMLKKKSLTFNFEFQRNSCRVSYRLWKEDGLSLGGSLNLGNRLRGGEIGTAISYGSSKIVLKSGISRNFYGNLRGKESILLISSLENLKMRLYFKNFMQGVRNYSISLAREGKVELGYYLRRTDNGELTKISLEYIVKVGLFIYSIRDGMHSFYIVGARRLYLQKTGSGVFVHMKRKLGKFKLSSYMVYTKGCFNFGLSFTFSGLL